MIEIYDYRDGILNRPIENVGIQCSETRPSSAKSNLLETGIEESKSLLNGIPPIVLLLPVDSEGSMVKEITAG